MATHLMDLLFGNDSGSGPQGANTSIIGWDVDAQTRFEITSKQSNDLPLSRGYTLGSGEDSMKLLELMELFNAVRHMLMLPVQVPAVEGHNVGRVLDKAIESDGFVEIIDFLKASSVHYALTVNPIIYTSYIKQFWATAKVQTVNGVRQLQALVDKKRVIITESSIRCDLHLEDAGGTDCLPTATIFEELATGKDFLRRITPLFDTMMVQASEEVGEDSDHPTDSNQIPIVDQPSTSSQPKQKRNKSLRGRQRKEAEVAHDETVLDLEKAKDAQAKETADLKKRSRGWKGKRSQELQCCSTIPTTVEETLAQTLMEIKAAKPKAKGIVFHDQEEQVFVSKPTVSVTQPLVKDKGKGIIQEPERPLIRKEQVAIDEQMARDIQAQLDAEIIEEERL
ncbi:hypothetical protein Tco_1343484 [Tanacetum coccineum]